MMSQSSNFRDNPFRSWLPPQSLSAWRQEMADQMRNFLGDPLGTSKDEMSPQVDVVETADAIEIAVDLPGFRKEDIQIELEEKCVIVTGSRQLESEQQDEQRKFHRIERRTGSFSRTVWLPCPVAEDGTSAQLSNGILKIQLRKLTTAPRRTVPIQGD